MTDYTRDFLAFYRDIFRVEGKYGPKPLILPFMEKWIHTAFPDPEGNPAARNIIDARVKKTGKSSLAGGVVTYMATRQEYSECVIVASDQDQSRDRVLRAVKYAIEHGPLVDHAKIYKDVIEFDNHSIIQAIPYDARGAAGGQYSCIIFDELHTWIYENYRRMFDELIPSPTVDAGVRWIASYAGFTGESLLLQELWQRALNGVRIDKELPFYLDERSSLLAFIDTGEAAWRMPWLTREFMATVKASERPNTYRRLWLNEWVTNESAFLPEGAWDRCKAKDVKPWVKGDKARLVVGVDASTSRDYTALVGTEWNESTQTVDVRLVRVWKPQKGLFRGGKPTVDLAETVGKEIKALKESGVLQAVVIDPYQLHSLSLDWQRMGVKVIELAQNSGRVEADQNLYDAVIGQSIRHWGDHNLDEAIRNCIALETVRGFRITKEKTSLHIDAAVALSMSHYACRDKANQYTRVEVHESPLESGEIQSEWNQKPHPPGVTWQNCRYRNKGCKACYEETKAMREADSTFWSGFIPESWEDRFYNAYMSRQSRVQEPDPTPVIDMFWNNVQKDIVNQNSHNQKREP